MLDVKEYTLIDRIGRTKAQPILTSIANQRQKQFTFGLEYRPVKDDTQVLDN